MFDFGSSSEGVGPLDVENSVARLLDRYLKHQNKSMTEIRVVLAYMCGLLVNVLQDIVE